MSQMALAELLSGIIFGDHATEEYIYLPAGEVGADFPLCILEIKKQQRDLSLTDAAALIMRLHLRPVRHPRMGASSF